MSRYRKIIAQSKSTNTLLSRKSQRKNNRCKTTISDLPNEMLLYILSLLPQEVILSKVNVVCKRWNQLTKCASFWKRVVLNDKMSSGGISKWISMAPQLKHLVVQHRDDLGAILNRVSQKCKHLETLEVYNSLGSPKTFIVHRFPMCNLISRCYKLRNIQFYNTRFQSCKFFKLLPKNRIVKGSKPCCYGGAISFKQLNAFLKSIKGNKMENSVVFEHKHKMYTVVQIKQLLGTLNRENQTDIEFNHFFRIGFTRNCKRIVRVLKN